MDKLKLIDSRWHSIWHGWRNKVPQRGTNTQLSLTFNSELDIKWDTQYSMALFVCPVAKLICPTNTDHSTGISPRHSKRAGRKRINWCTARVDNGMTLKQAVNKDAVIPCDGLHTSLTARVADRPNISSTSVRLSGEQTVRESLWQRVPNSAQHPNKNS